MKLQRIFLQDNAVLQKLILAQLHELAGGIELLESGLSSESGPLCLGIDEERRFVLLISTVQEEDAMLVKALGQMSWLNRYQSLLARLFSKRGVESSQSPRAVLIAPAFSSVLQNAVALVGLDIELFQYRAVEFEQQTMLLFDPVWVLRRKAGQPAVSVSANPSDLSSRSALTDAERNFLENPSPKSLPT